MTRVLAVSGLGLDRAWPDLGSVLGAQLREWSVALLAEVGQAVSRAGAERLLLVGDLFDRATVTPATVEYVGAVLGSVGVPVVVIPGRSDWYGEGSPYIHAAWPDNVSIVSSSVPVACDGGETLWASAWTGAVEHRLVLPSGLGAQTTLLVRPDVSDPALLTTQLPAATHLLTSSARVVVHSRATVLTPLATLDQPVTAQLLTLQGDGAWEAEVVGLSACPVALKRLDVAEVKADRDLYEAVLAAAGDTPAVVRLSGALPAGVLPPSLHTEPLPPHVVVDEDELEYAEPRGRR